MTLERILKLYYSKSLYRLSPPERGAARRLVAAALDDPNTPGYRYTTLTKILTQLIDA